MKTAKLNIEEQENRRFVLENYKDFPINPDFMTETMSLETVVNTLRYKTAIQQEGYLQWLKKNTNKEERDYWVNRYTEFLREYILKQFPEVDNVTELVQSNFRQYVTMHIKEVYGTLLNFHEVTGIKSDDYMNTMNYSRAQRTRVTQWLARYLKITEAEFVFNVLLDRFRKLYHNKKSFRKKQGNFSTGKRRMDFTL